MQFLSIREDVSSLVDLEYLRINKGVCISPPRSSPGWRPLETGSNVGFLSTSKLRILYKKKKWAKVKILLPFYPLHAMTPFYLVAETPLVIPVPLSRNKILLFPLLHVCVLLGCFHGGQNNFVVFWSETTWIYNTTTFYFFSIWCQQRIWKMNRTKCCWCLETMKQINAL
jgi:hypothetical protein